MTAALVLAGFGFMRLTAARTPAALPSVAAAGQAGDALSGWIPGRFHLLLSAPAAEWAITSSPGSGETRGEPATAPTGILLFDPDDPQVFLTVRWAAAPVPGEHRFAKLTLELPGRPTIVHFFDAPGDIDEFLELPLP
jgi:hypothetical protein